MTDHRLDLPDLPSFSPHPLLAGGVRQTVLAYLIGSRPTFPSTEERLLELPDGDSLVLSIDPPVVDATPPKATVVLFHGLGGSRDSLYNMRIARKLTLAGFRAVRVDHRGASPDSLPHSRGIYHAGSSADAKCALAFLARLFPNESLLAVGFSLSGNIVLKAMAEVSDERERAGASPEGTPLAALSVCAPIDLELCSRNLDAARNLLFDQFFAALMRQRASHRARAHPGEPKIDLPWFLTLRAFDELYTARVAGFRSRDHYFAASAAKPVLARIRIPTLILAAADDPIIPEASYEGVSSGPYVRFRMERSGGHMGFLARSPTPLGDHRWLDLAVLSWARAALIRPRAPFRNYP